MVTPTSFLNNLSSVARNESIQASPIRNSFGFTAEEIKAVFEKVLNESSLPSEQMEKFKLYLLDSLNLFDSFSRFDGNKISQTTMEWIYQDYELYHILYIGIYSVISPVYFSYGSRYMRNKPASPILNSTQSSRKLSMKAVLHQTKWRNSSSIF
ncbi:hypothetical protein Ddc_21676 [Ditylenchus destructor]|nr:hypothetical protein Ddc_21676 [Ditylenchus destructor]